MRVLLQASVLSLFVLTYASSQTQAAVPYAAGTDSPQAVQTYLRGLSSVVRLVQAANTNIVAGGTAVANGNNHEAASLLVRAAAKEREARKALDTLSVPPKAGRIQGLVRQALDKFISGTDIMRRGAADDDDAQFFSGLAVYARGDQLLAQVSRLIATLAR